MITEEAFKLANHCNALRQFYTADNRFGLLLDEVEKDIRSNKPRKKIINDARKAIKELNAPRSQLHRFLSGVLQTYDATQQGEA